MPPSPLPYPGLVVAVDGPGGSGKSSVSRGVATALGLRYLDTGAMYRAITWFMLHESVPVDDPDAVAAACGAPSIEVGTDPQSPTVAVDGVDVAAAIRGSEVTAAVSAVSAVPAVRERLVRIQRAVIEAGGVVVEGRDIGTVVVPDAPLKVFLTASARARAERRHAEHPHADVHAAQADLARRDAHDSGREASPLARADDAVEVDSTDMTLDEVIAHIVALAREAAQRR